MKLTNNFKSPFFNFMNIYQITILLSNLGTFLVLWTFLKSPKKIQNHEHFLFLIYFNSQKKFKFEIFFEFMNFIQVHEQFLNSWNFQILEVFFKLVNFLEFMNVFQIHEHFQIRNFFKFVIFKNPWFFFKFINLFQICKYFFNSRINFGFTNSFSYSQTFLFKFVIYFVFTNTFFKFINFFNLYKTESRFSWTNSLLVFLLACATDR